MFFFVFSTGFVGLIIYIYIYIVYGMFEGFYLLCLQLLPNKNLPGPYEFLGTDGKRWGERRLAVELSC